MVSIALIVSINYYLISFLTVTFERPYIQVIFASLAEILAYATSGLLFKRLGAKASLALTLLISAVGGLTICFYGVEHQNSIFFTFLVMMCKFGISGTYNIQLCTLVLVYPSSFIATGFGIGHFFGVIFQISSPFLAELKEPIPIAIFTGLCVLAAFISLFIKPREIKVQAQSES